MSLTSLVLALTYSIMLATIAKAMGYKVAEIQQFWKNNSWPRRVVDCLLVAFGMAFVIAVIVLLSLSREWGVEFLSKTKVVAPLYVKVAFVFIGAAGFAVTVVYTAVLYQDRVEQDRSHRALVRERKALRKFFAKEWDPYVKAADSIRNEWIAAHAASWKRAKLEMAQFNFAAAGANPDKAFPPGFLELPPELIDGPVMPVTDSPETVTANGPLIDPKLFN